MCCWVTVVRVAGLETPPAQTVGRALLPGAVGAALHGGDWQLWVEETAAGRARRRRRRPASPGAMDAGPEGTRPQGGAAARWRGEKGAGAVHAHTQRARSQGQAAPPSEDGCCAGSPSVSHFCLWRCCPGSTGSLFQC